MIEITLLAIIVILLVGIIMSQSHNAKIIERGMKALNALEELHKEIGKASVKVNFPKGGHTPKEEPGIKGEDICHTMKDAPTVLRTSDRHFSNEHKEQEQSISSQAIDDVVLIVGKAKAQMFIKHLAHRPELSKDMKNVVLSYCDKVLYGIAPKSAVQITLLDFGCNPKV